MAQGSAAQRYLGSVDSGTDLDLNNKNVLLRPFKSKLVFLKA